MIGELFIHGGHTYCSARSDQKGVRVSIVDMKIALASGPSERRRPVIAKNDYLKQGPAQL